MAEIELRSPGGRLYIRFDMDDRSIDRLELSDLCDGHEDVLGEACPNITVDDVRRFAAELIRATYPEEVCPDYQPPAGEVIVRSQTTYKAQCDAPCYPEDRCAHCRSR